MKRNNLDIEVYNILINQIMDGRYNAGEKISIEDLAAELGVSVTPVLGALRKLVYEGLVVTIRGKGYHVATFSEEDLNEMLSAVNSIFLMAFEHILANESEDVLANLYKLSEKAQKEFDEGDYQAYLQTDAEFHESIIKELDNQYIIKFYNDMFRQICYCYQASRDSTHRGINTALPDNHFNICDALKRRDREALKEALIADFPMRDLIFSSGN
jgi:DNA-binding GntR family transcriptional regulator